MPEKSQDARFEQDEAFYKECVARRIQMINFMKNLGIKSMRTQIQNRDAATVKLLVQY